MQHQPVQQWIYETRTRCDPLCFYMLIDWDGSDLKNVYEPISQQIAYLFAFLFLLAGLAWRKTKRWNRERQERPIPYRVV